MTVLYVNVTSNIKSEFIKINWDLKHDFKSHLTMIIYYEYNHSTMIICYDLLMLHTYCHCYYCKLQKN